MANKQKKAFLSRTWVQNLLYVTAVMIVGLLIMSIIDSIESLQFRLFARPDSLLFVYTTGSSLKYMILFMSLALILIFSLAIWSAKTVFFKRFFAWLIGGLVLGNVIFFYVTFGHYYDVTRDAIYYNNTLTNEKKTYSYEDIIAVHVHYDLLWHKKRRNDLDVNYEVMLYDGKSFNAYYSWQEKDQLILFDQLMELQDVSIVRNPPSSNKLYRLCGNTECSPVIKYIYRME